MTVHFEGAGVTVLRGECIEEMRGLPNSSVHAVVTDPPYGLSNTDPAHVVEALGRWTNGDRSFLPSGAGFMGKAWDAFVPPPAVWDEAMRVLKPGGHLLAFAGSRTFDLMTLSIRLAGFDIRDGIAWLYGSGFPKSLDVSKAIDKAAGAEREVIGAPKIGGTGKGAAYGNITRAPKTKPTAANARDWEGWGTALKPAFEPIVVARKPLAGTVAANVLAHGTGALHIDANRISTADALPGVGGTRRLSNEVFGKGLGVSSGRSAELAGRWPTNVILDESQADALDGQSGTLSSGTMRAGTERQPRQGGTIYGADARTFTPADTYGDSGGASRFFPTFRYEAKAPTSERPSVDGVQHPTVKPLDLMRWLVRLVTPPGGTVLEPFAGSGTTVEACLREGFSCIAIEREADYLPLIMSRIQKDHEQSLFGQDDLG